MKNTSHFARVFHAKTGVIFLGAGASSDSGLPLGDAAAKDLIHTCFVEVGLAHLIEEIEKTASLSQPLAWPRFEVVLDTVAKYLPEGPVEILRSFQRVGLSSTHRVLAEQLPYPWLWLTTNFDDQIETALELAGKPYSTIARRAEMNRIRHKLGSQHVVLKLHGDPSAGPEDLGATIDQILRTFPGHILRLLTNVVAGKPVIFIGYAARDPDLRPFVDEIVKRASHILWVGYGPKSALVSPILQRGGRKCRYYESGAPAVFGEEMALTPPAPQHFASWHNNISAWARAKAANPDNRLRLLHGLAALCTLQDNSPCRAACQKILEVIPTAEEPHRSWCFQHHFRLLEQMPTNADPSFSRFLEEWQHSINRNDPPLDPQLASESRVLLSSYFRKHGKYEQARVTAEQALSSLPPQSSPVLRITGLRTLGLAQIYCGARWLPQALKTLRRARKLAHRMGEPVLEAQATEELAFGHVRSNDGKEATKLLKQVEPTYREVGDPRLLLSWRRNYAESLRMQGDVRGALQLNQEALEYAALLDDYESRRKLVNNLALCRMQIGLPVEADRSLDECIQEALQKGRFEYIADPLHNRGWIRAMAGDWQEAERFMLPVIDLQLKRGSRERAGGSLCLLGWCRLCLGNEDAATELLARVIQEDLIPAGPPRGHFLLLELALSQASRDIDPFVRSAMRRLANFPEQRFFALAWLLGLRGKDLGKSQASQIVIRCWSAVQDSKESVLAAVLDSMIATLGISVKRSVKLAIQRMSPGEIADIRQRLAVQATGFAIDLSIGPSGGHVSPS